MDKSSALLSLSIFCSVPDWIEKFPNDIFKIYLRYTYQYPFVGIIVGIATAALITFVIYLAKKGYDFFGFKKNISSDDDSKIETIRDLERRIGKLNGCIESLQSQYKQKTEEIKRLHSINADIKKSFRKIEETYKVVEYSLSQIKFAIYYLTTPNKSFDGLMAKKAKEKDNLFKEFYDELQYNLYHSLVDNENDIRVSIMRLNGERTSLEIISTFSNFNHPAEEMELNICKGFASRCIELKKIINIKDVTDDMIPSSSEVAVHLQSYMPPKDIHSTKASLNIPIYVLGEAEGVLNIVNSRAGAFKEEDELVASLFAERISMAWTVEKHLRKRIKSR